MRWNTPLNFFRRTPPTSLLRALRSKIGGGRYHSYSTSIFASRSDSQTSALQTKILGLVPVKVMVFVDGTWLYYSLLKGRHDCPVKMKFGETWKRNYRVDWPRLISLIGENLSEQLFPDRKSANRGVEVIRTIAFTSSRKDTHPGGVRMKMIRDFQLCNFETHLFETTGLQEKCVDISLAVEMLHLATLPDAYDIAVIITGDKDFIPAMQKTRLQAKRVAICSMRNSCNKDLFLPEQRVRDFDAIWLDDYLEDIVVPRFSLDNLQDECEIELIDLIKKFLDEDISNTSRELGRYLTRERLETSQIYGRARPALEYMKEIHTSMTRFFNRYDSIFTTTPVPDAYPDFYIEVAGEPYEEEVSCILCT